MKADRNENISNVKAAVMVPHPPIILPNIGKGEEKKIADIDRAYIQAAKTAAQADADTIVIISPHAPSYADYIQVSSSPVLSGSMKDFGDSQDAFVIENDTELAREIDRIASQQDFPMGVLGDQSGVLDHGTMVPLYYLEKEKPKSRARYMRVSPGGLSNLDHYRAGMLIEQAAKNLGRSISVVASGDLSHCQNPDSHYGFKECGPKYDEKVMNEMAQANFKELVETEQKEAREAMSCGHQSFAILGGILDGLGVRAERLAHSAVFGVGYGICTYTDIQSDESRKLYESMKQDLEEKRKEARKREDPYVSLARNVIEQYVQNQTIPSIPSGLPEEMLENRAGAFVSIHENGSLRGCIGTTSATQKNLALEIMANAVSACSKDPRFYPVRPAELDALEINVDVLEPAQPCTKKDLDPKEYGVIVTKGSRRGLLLPDLEGVDTADQQIAIAKQKAGIAENEHDVQLERFKVVRHR